MASLKDIRHEIETAERKLEQLRETYDSAYARAVVNKKERRALLTVRQAAIAFGKNKRRISNMFSKELREHRVKNGDGKAAVPYGVIEDYYADSYERQTVTPSTRRAALALTEEGMSEQKVADKLGISRSTVTRIKREAKALHKQADD